MSDQRSSQRPLQGIRVVELSIAIAAPTCGKYLAHFGADVVKVESARNPDVIRLLARDTGSALGEFNAGKRSLGLDLKSEGGREAVRKLLANSDVFLTNYTAPAIAGLGLTYDEVREVRPDIVYAGLPGFGARRDAPYYDFVAWGPNQAPLVGLDALTGVPGGDPAGIATISYPDYSSGVHAVVAVLAELRRRARTGQGAYIDLSQMEATVSLLGPLVLAHDRTGVTPGPAGNRRPGLAPQGVYACRGDDRWVAVTVVDDERWEALCAVAGHPEWAGRAEWSGVEGRLAHHDEIDAAISAWTAGHSAVEVAAWLQEAGVAACPVLDNEALVVDEHLGDRRFWALAPHPRVGLDLFTGIPLHLSRADAALASSGPPFAEHTRAVLGEVCGYDAAAIDALVAAEAAFEPSVDPNEPSERPWKGWARVAMPWLGWTEATPAPTAPGPPAPSVAPGALVGEDAAAEEAAGSCAGLEVVALGGPEIGQAVRILVGSGARVTIVEPPGGGALRRAEAGDLPSGSTLPGLWHEAFAGGTSSEVLDLSDPTDAARFVELAAGADLVLEAAAPGLLSAMGIDHDVVRARNERLVWASITPFGRSGPRSHWQGSDLVAWAASGVLYTTGHPDTPPLVPGGSALLAGHMASLNALAGALVALAERDRTGQGQLVDVSMQEAVVAVACETGVPIYLADQQHRPRQGNRRPLLRPWGLYACKDGWVSIVILQPGHWDAIAAWMNERTGNDVALDPVFRDLMTRVETPELLDGWAEELTATYTKAELFAEGQARGVPVTPVTTVADLLADPHLAATGFWHTSASADGTQVRLPGPPWRIAGRPWTYGAAPPVGRAVEARS